ncbi:Zinc knuckle CX2CX4HX4C [Parasponia andersonii]|uniref:Zinc knuckle CX2CX4HX4C n=1 Tax=Parasponia andersonii TaxID=3476 RepID=A0A2P5AJD0_PARAD|nr:Zinc knuckle CX2CX4HX4C [Parasponia andersonii]
MANAEDSISKAIDSIIQKSSALKYSESTLQPRPNVPTAEYACRLVVAVKILDQKFFTKKLLRTRFLMHGTWSTHGRLGLSSQTKILILIGKKIGRFLEFQFKAEGYVIWSCYLRIKVDVPLAQPLLAGFYLEKPNYSKVWIQLKYERLSDFCYRCGCIGHGPKKCRELKTTSMEGLDGKDYSLYGPWLRAVCYIPSCFRTINTSASNPSSLANPSHKLNSKLIVPTPHC